MRPFTFDAMAAWPGLQHRALAPEPSTGSAPRNASHDRHCPLNAAMRKTPTGLRMAPAACASSQAPGTER